MNTHTQTFTPLVCSVIDDALLKAMPAIPYCRSVHVMNYSEKDPLLNFYANFVVQWVRIWMLEPWTWWNKSGCLPFQKSQMEDTDTRLCALIELTHCFAVRSRTCHRSCTWQAVTVESEVCYCNMCQIIWITLNKKLNEFRCKFL